MRELFHQTREFKYYEAHTYSTALQPFSVATLPTPTLVSSEIGNKSAGKKGPGERIMGVNPPVGMIYVITLQPTDSSLQTPLEHAFAITMCSYILV